MTELPAPLTPLDCDLRNFTWMPITITKLRQSKGWSICKRRPELAFYMINLWIAAWHSVPAGSLDDDDDMLCDLAMCDAKRWEKIRAVVMRNWTKCSDGRLYHPTVAEEAMMSWGHKKAQKARTEAATEARRARRGGDRGGGGDNDDGQRHVHVTDNVSTTSRSPQDKTDKTDKTDRTKKEESAEPAQARATTRRATRLPPDWQPSEPDLAFLASKPALDVRKTIDGFRDYWIAKAGRDGTKLDWSATFRNWVRTEKLPEQPARYRNGFIEMLVEQPVQFEDLRKVDRNENR